LEDGDADGRFGHAAKNADETEFRESECRTSNLSPLDCSGRSQ
jgi:hypothetical protein